MRPNVQVSFVAPWQVELIEKPHPVAAAGEVLIETRRSLISAGTELVLLSGEHWSPLATGQAVPAVGYSNVGTVIGAGGGVDDSWIGRRVASRSIHARYATCRIEPTVGQWRSGVFAIPDALSDDDASLFALGVTAMHGVHLARPLPAESVAVVGLGMLGQLVVRDLARRAASRVLAVGRSAERLRYLPSNVRGVSGGAEACAASGEPAVDLAFEVSGNPHAIAEALGLLRAGGRLVLLGSSRGETTLDFHAACTLPGRSIIGAHILSLPARPAAGDPWCVAEAAAAFFDASEPSLRTGPALVTHRFAAGDAALAYAHVRAPSASTLGCVLDWTEAS